MLRFPFIELGNVCVQDQPSTLSEYAFIWTNIKQAYLYSSFYINSFPECLTLVVLTHVVYTAAMMV